jgi:hypothetical protein
MPGRGPQTFKKRQKEQQRKEKQQEKMAKRLARKDGLVTPGPSDEDYINDDNVNDERHDLETEVPGSVANQVPGSVINH